MLNLQERDLGTEVADGITGGNHALLQFLQRRQHTLLRLPASHHVHMNFLPRLSQIEENWF